MSKDKSKKFIIIISLIIGLSFIASFIFIKYIFEGKKLHCKRYEVKNKLSIDYSYTFGEKKENTLILYDLYVYKKIKEQKSAPKRVKILNNIDFNKITNPFVKKEVLKIYIDYLMEKNNTLKLEKIVKKWGKFLETYSKDLYYYSLYMINKKSSKKRKEYAIKLLKNYPLSKYSKKLFYHAKYLSKKEFINFMLENLKNRRYSTFRKLLYKINNRELKNYLLGEYYLKRRNYSSAKRLFIKLLDSNDDFIKRLSSNSLLRIYYKKGKITGIEKAIEIFREKNIDPFFYSLRAGNYYYSNLFLNRAYKYYKISLSYEKDKNYILDKILRIYLAYGLKEKAIKTSKKLITETKKKIPSYIYIYATLIKSENQELSEKLFKKIAGDFYNHYYGELSLKKIKTKNLENSKFLYEPPIYKPEVQRILYRAYFFEKYGFTKASDYELKKISTLYQGEEDKIILTKFYGHLNNYYKSHINLLKIEGNYAFNFPKELYYHSYPLTNYYPIIKKYSKKHSLDPLFVLSLIRQESFFNEKVVSYAGAIGLMQLLYSTAKSQARESGIPFRRRWELFNPQKNIEIGIAHLGSLFSELKNPIDVLCAYNAGKHRVYKWREFYREIPDDLYVELIPFTQTRKYVKIILTNYRIYRMLYDEKN